jgi:phthiodiolone/phenolphthiodiolone dimycocerosates ketoreductase
MARTQRVDRGDMTTDVKFGLCGQMFPPIDAALESAHRAEQLGWDFINYPDQLSGTHPLGMLKPPVPAGDPCAPSGMFSETWFGSFEMCAAAAATTREIEIMLAVVDPLRRSPALMAQEMATLMHLSKGRISFALASGEAKQFEPYGERRVKPIAKLEESLQIFRALWNSGGRPVTRESEFWPLTNAVFPIPRYDEREPDILLVGGTERMFKLAGEQCAGWLTFLPGGCMDDLDLLKEMIDAVKGFAAAGGRDPERLRFVAQVFFVLAETDDNAWQLLRTPNAGWLGVIGASIAGGAAWKKWGYEHPFGDFNWARDMDITLVSREQAAELVEKLPDEVLDHCAVWGSPDKVATRLQEFADVGITEFSLFNFAGACDPESAVHWDGLASDLLTRLGHAPLKASAGV